MRSTENVNELTNELVALMKGRVKETIAGAVLLSGGLVFSVIACLASEYSESKPTAIVVALEGGHDIYMIPSEIWTLIGVVVGIILAFVLELIRDWRREKETKRKYLKDLLADLEYNKRLAESDITDGYHTLGYTDAKESKYLPELPKEIRIDTDNIQRIILAYRLQEFPPLTAADFDKFEPKTEGRSAVMIAGISEYSRLRTEQLVAVKRVKILLEHVIPKLTSYLKEENLIQ